MAVTSFGELFQGNGTDESLQATFRAHRENTDALLNLSEGKKTTAFREPYDPTHPDNQWPRMVHHPVKGELTLGKNLKGVTDARVRSQIEKSNKEELAKALASGYRLEPYVKPPVPLADPATEKLALLKRNEELAGQLNEQNDRQIKLLARFEALEAGLAAASQAQPPTPPAN